MSTSSIEPLLAIENINISFNTTTGNIHAVKDASLTMYAGQSVAIVGESGSGKSTIAAAIIGLLAKNAVVSSGSINFDGQDITHQSEAAWQEIRGKKIGLVPQNPMSNLNPLWDIKFQVAEAVAAHQKKITKQQKREKAIEALENAGLADATEWLSHYPHELSGGMKQRILIAMGLAAEPKLLIADEPTSALDVTVQKRILDHLMMLIHETDTALLFITHDLGLAAERAEHLVVMYRGQVVESGPTLDVLRTPKHSYTKKLIQAAPNLASSKIIAEENSSKYPNKVLDKEPIIRFEGVSKIFSTKRMFSTNKQVQAVNKINLDVLPGRTLAIVGESGSGKSTLSNMLLRMTEPSEGKILFNNKDITQFSKSELFAFRRHVQAVFQNPYGALNPMHSIYYCLEEPLKLHKFGNSKKREARIHELMNLVDLSLELLNRYPNELSGGQLQRVSIAKALSLHPQVLVLDEAVSALDVLVQDQILKLLVNLQAQLQLTYIFITHDLGVVRQIADDVAVMQSGMLVEYGSADAVLHSPKEEYTRNLIDAVPSIVF